MKCPTCQQEIPDPKCEWLATEDVVRDYRFNPYIVCVNEPNKIHSKLVHSQRVWLKEDVVQHSLEVHRGSA